MDEAQQVRAVAIQAAAAFCAPIGYVEGGTIHSPEDVLYVAGVFEEYVKGGWEAGLQASTLGIKNLTNDDENPVKNQGNVEDVELREQQQAPAGVTTGPAEGPSDPQEPIDLLREVQQDEQRNAAAREAVVSFDADPVSITGNTPQIAPVIGSGSAMEPAPSGAMTGLGTVTSIQATARSKIERLRKGRAEQFANLARTAKVQEHKNRLRDDIAEADLLDYQLMIDGKLWKLKDYLKHVWKE